MSKLRLLDPVSLYIPEFKSWVSEDGKDKKIIRIADLLTHTSGLPLMPQPVNWKNNMVPQSRRNDRVHSQLPPRLQAADRLPIQLP
ncbi:MAG: serine hydrolase domain-containing protein [Bacteroides cellulosilyticus]